MVLAAAAAAAGGLPTSNGMVDAAVAVGTGRLLNSNVAVALELNKPATSDDIVVLISDFDQHPFEKFVSCAADYCRKLRPSALCVTGGATLSAILQALGATSLTVESGVAANTPLCRVVGGQFDGLTVVSKAGGLGPDDVWVSAVFLI